MKKPLNELNKKENCDTSWYSETCVNTKNWIETLLASSLCDCCDERLSNFNIQIGELCNGSGDANQACTLNKHFTSGGTRSFLFNPALRGRYLYAQQKLHHALVLCKAEVYEVTDDFI